MNLLIWIMIGSIAGALCSALMRVSKFTAQRTGLVLNIVVGATGALLGGSLLAPIFGTGSIDVQHYTNGKLIVAIVSALALLSLVNFFDQTNKRS